MCAKIFISCGQSESNVNELRVGKAIKKLCLSEGFDVFQAKGNQKLGDTNESIISELKTSDIFLFVDFKREKVKGGKYRGSLYTHQELAIAYFLKFENILIFREKLVELNGISSYLLSNAYEFNNYAQLNKEIKKRLKLLDKDYCRNLVAGCINISETAISYTDQLGPQNNQIVWSCKIMNKRTYKTAKNVEGFLKEIKYPDGQVKNFKNDSKFLKWAGHYMRYTQTIPPQESRNMDLFGISLTEPYKLFLHDDSDSIPRRAINYDNSSKKGEYILTYGLYADGFPEKEISVRVELTGKVEKTIVELIR